MKAVIYCRVSTDEESQLNALEDQIQEAKNCVSSMQWELVDSYIDEGKSGTSIKKRNEYKRLFDDLSTCKFDVIVIKSQDRLMRNVKEWYIFVDILVSNNKKLYFYLDSKFYTTDDALITGIKAILAEEFSRDLSKKIKNAHRNRQTSGKSILITSATWGYDKVDKQVVINEKEAEIVRLIFDLCIQGYGSRSISKLLSNRGVHSRTGGTFPEITIRRIIRNPLFMGTVVMNKKTTDFNTKRTTNNPKEEWIIHKNSIPPIVSPDIWEEANRIMDSRSQEVKTDEFKAKKIGKKIGNYELSSKIYCGLCGSIYWRRYRRGYKNKDEIIVDWSCSEYVKRGRNKLRKDKKGVAKKVESPDRGCDNIHIKEVDMLNLLSEVANSILVDKKEHIIEYAMSIIKDVLGEENIHEERLSIDREKNKILKQKDLLLDKLLDGTITDDDYKRRDNELEKKLENTLADEKGIDQKELTSMSMNERINDIRSILDETNLDESKTQKLIKHIVKIVIFTDHLEIYFDFYEKLNICIHKKGENKCLYVYEDKYLASIYYQITQARICNKELADYNADKGQSDIDL